MGQPCRAETSGASSVRDEHTVVTWPSAPVLIAAIWAPAGPAVTDDPDIELFHKRHGVNFRRSAYRRGLALSRLEVQRTRVASRLQTYAPLKIYVSHCAPKQTECFLVNRRSHVRV